MGDMADYYTEQGQDAWFAHLAGQCGPDRCPYCEKEETEKKKEKNVKIIRNKH